MSASGCGAVTKRHSLERQLGAENGQIRSPYWRAANIDLRYGDGKMLREGQFAPLTDYVHVLLLEQAS